MLTHKHNGTIAPKISSKDVQYQIVLSTPTGLGQNGELRFYFDGTNIIPFVFKNTWIQLDLSSYRSIASTSLVSSADTYRFTSNTTYTKVKEVTVYVSGTIQITFELARNIADASAQASLRKNEVEVASYSTTTIYPALETFTQTPISVSYGDTLQLYIKSTGGNQANTQNFRIYYTSGVSPNVALD